ncbi:hypothetical protein [Agromyces bracchium]|uniref:DUF3558 domain-containing protein n=1 Tax=Agromyces bracchium TaxID=88376 RepID=A0A6I3MCK2_9MICO|nr:hypothetical protein [Agromyces bracchium]MTH69727.1 hypothetical protein [Agromyces bracchium]
MPDAAPASRRSRTLLIVAASALVIAVVALVAALALPAPGSQSAEPTSQSRPAPSAEAAPAPVAVPTPEPVRDERIPTDCAGIYTFDWSSTFAPGYVLNPEWSTADGAPALYGTDDTGALPVLQETSQLTCAWLPPEGGDGRVGLVTNVASVDEEQTAAAIAAFQAAGQECYQEEGGTRCILEFEGVAGSAGESHFIREGLWIATRWDGPEVSGYTVDIMAQLFS